MQNTIAIQTPKAKKTRKLDFHVNDEIENQASNNKICLLEKKNDLFEKTIDDQKIEIKRLNNLLEVEKQKNQNLMNTFSKLINLSTYKAIIFKYFIYPIIKIMRIKASSYKCLSYLYNYLAIQAI